MKYQLLLQLPEELYGDLDWIVDMEDRLSAAIGKAIVDAEIDGHDMGSGEVNIFIHANEPIKTFQLAKYILEESGMKLEKLKAAYRDFTEDHYILLRPENSVNFKII